MEAELEVIEKKSRFGQAVASSIRSPSKETENEDDFLIENITGEGFLLVVSDGMGGHKGGAFASKTVIDCVRPVRRKKNTYMALAALVRAIEVAHRKIKKKGIGAGSTFVGAIVLRKSVRFISVGDSKGLHLGGLSVLKYESIEHSPVGFAQESGLIEDAQEVFAEEGHLISNVLGHGEIRIEISQAMPIAKKDTILLASDGLLSNISVKEVSQYFRAGELKDNIKSLMSDVHKKMQSDGGSPDDLTVVAFNRS